MSKSAITPSLDLKVEGKHRGYLQLAHSVHRSAYGKLMIPVVAINNGEGPRVLLSAGNHGDEYEGQVALMALARRLEPADIKGRLLIIPALNLPAVEAGERTSPLDGGNLNRSFPGDPHGTPTEQIAHFVEAVLLAETDFVIDLHSGGTSLEFAAPTLVARRERESAAFERQRQLIELFGAPFTYLVEEATGSDTGMIGACVRQGVGHLTTELGGAGRVSIEGTRLAQAGVLRVLYALGALTRPLEPSAPGSTRLLKRGGLNSASFVYATDSGVFEPLAELGAEVATDQPAGLLHFHRTPWREPELYRFASAGVVIAKFRSGRVEPGDSLFVVGADWEEKPAGKPIVAQRMHGIKPSATKAMTARAAELAKAGADVIALSQGEPDFDTPLNIREAGKRAIDAGHTRYTAVAGIPALREAIAEKLRRENGLDYPVGQITVGAGAKQVLFNALFASLDAGDEVIVAAPCWVSYPEMVSLAGGTPVVVTCSEVNGFKLTPTELEAAITARTRWLMLNSPSNPTGAVYSAAELTALADVLRRHPQVWVLSDDIYEKLVYGEARFASLAAVAPDLKARTLVINGVSKANAMTGWRIGYGAGPAELIAAMNVIQSQTTSHATSIAQHAANEALSGDQSYLPGFVAEFERRRDLVVERLNRAEGLSCTAPDGAFYVFASCAGVVGKRTPAGAIISTDTDFAMYLLDCGVAVVPGSGFLASPYVRLSYAAGIEQLAAACDRIIAACANLTEAAST